MGAQFGDGFKVKDAVVSMSGPVFGWFVGGEKGARRKMGRSEPGKDKSGRGRAPSQRPPSSTASPHSFHAQYIPSSSTDQTVICYLHHSVKAQATRPLT
ncbi:Pre-mRNA-splicing factor spp42 [Fusarium oxysporum f. sp. albedinis]|nr:Pre-mRNA-splicing factor spp42 [Fusarium oxysporum f. sp. albedinis]